MTKPVSYHQERLWFIDRFERGNLYESSPLYHNVPLILKISGPLDIPSLERSIARVIDRHEALRTRVITFDHGPGQWIEPQAVFTLEFLELSTRGQETTGEELLNLALEEVHRPFLIEKDLLIRGKLYKEKPGEFLLVLVLHHIIADHYSLNLLVQEMSRIYSGIRSGKEPQLPGLTLHYADFARWQRDFSPKTLKPLQIYWKRKLRGKLQTLELPTDRPRALVHIFKAGRKNFSIPGTSSMITANLARQTGSSPMVVLLAAFKVLLYRYSGLEEIIVGTVVDNRTQPETRDIIGPIANLVALRSHISGEMTFSRFVSQLRETVEEAQRYGAMPFDRLVTELDPQKDMSRTALFDVLFQYRRYSPGWEEPGGLTIDIIETNLGWGKYDINVLVEAKGETLSGVVVYNAEYYDDWRISGMIDHFINITGQAAAHPDRQLESLEMLSPQEKNQLLEEWSGTAGKVDFPRDKTIVQLFEEQVEKYPDNIAIIGPQQEKYRTHMTYISYRELNHQSNQTAHWSKERGVGADTIVGITAGRSPGMVANMLGILKAGGAYLPIDPEYPQDRIDYMLKDSNVGILVTTPKLQVKVKAEVEKNFKQPLQLSLQFVNIETGPPAAFERSPSTLTSTSTCQVSSANLAYIIYTSGSTGRPKGVLITHRDVVRLFVNDRFQFDFGPRDVWTMFHSPCFDFSVWEMYGALLFGGKLLVIPRSTARDTQQYLQVLKNHRVTVLNQTPSAFYALMNEESQGGARELTLRYVIFGGEALAPGKIKPWQARYPHTRLINMYGITETTVHVTFKEITGKEIQENSGNIGKPIPTLFVYVLDSRMQPAVVGAPGQLCVGGEGLARGYLNQPRLTAEKFVENPHQHGSRLYLSGDIARYLNNSEMEYLGRMDTQVQLRGYRVETGEIESRLTACPWVKEAVVNVWEDEAGEKYLCAYYTPGHSHRDKGTGREELREYLRQSLPDYMIPAYFIPLGKIPLTANGKVDRKALPAPGIEREKDYAAPRDDIEKKLVELWSEILARDAGHASQLQTSIGIHDNFFRLGGHSLKVTVMVSKIQKNFGVKIAIQTIFMHPTIAAVAGIIKNSQISHSEEIEKLPQQPYYEMSYAQKRLWYIYRSNPRDTAFNMPAKWTFFEPVDAGLTRKVLERLMIRHESLRTSFKEVKEGSVQVIEPQETALSKLNFDVLDLSQLDQAERENQRTRLLKQESSHVFNLEAGPHFRARLVKCSEEEYDIIINIHHIAADGWSLDVFKKEFLQVYESYKKGIDCELEPLKIQYKDYAAWQNRQLKDEEKMAQAKESWKNYLKDSITALNLPYDFSSKPMGTKKSSAYCFLIEAGLAEKLRLFAGEQKVSLFIVLLAAFNVLLSHISHQDNILVGIPAAARQHWSLKNIIGLFVNTLILQSKVIAKETFIDFLKRFQIDAFNVLEYQAYPLEIIFGELKIKYPEISTFFNMVNIGTSPDEHIQDFKSYHCEEVQETKFPIHCYLMEYKNGIRMECHYYRELFRPQTIEKIMQIYTRILENLTTSPLKRIKELARKIEKIPV
jgi:amino acid adenylation domain-containing protein